MASDLIVRRQLRVTCDWLFANNTREFLLLKQPQKHSDLQGNGVASRYDDGCGLD